MFEQAFAAANLPGAVGMIVDREGVRHSSVLGVTDIDSKTPMAEDTQFQIASMTKALATVAAMQLVEAGRLALDAPIGDVLPELADPQVLTGFGGDGKPQTRPAARPITLRHLLTHTAGFGYFFIHPELLQYFAAVGMPVPGSIAGISTPLLFDPGDRWEYSVSIDWAGLAVEAVTGSKLGDYMAEHVFAPLGMTGTGFYDALPEGAAKVHVRDESGALKVQPMFLGGGEYHNAGGGLVGTAPDYARFVRAMLRGGELDGQRILSAETVAEMGRNQVAPLRAGFMGSAMPHLAQPYDTLPDQHTGWGLGFLINPETGPDGRSPGSLAWAGIFNSYYWIDPAKGVGGVMMSQLSPFGDKGALDCFGALERMAYG
ncbi:MAG TPA: serine hydrolase domain-containing protein [Novosphingobium sp.]|nr:serine hydrolase domain-containing protein [Novosphingobium sp.]HQA16942.1 serine hydrolase domain-containing protein [Novosphingobium sp.]